MRTSVRRGLIAAVYLLGVLAMLFGRFGRFGIGTLGAMVVWLLTFMLLAGAGHKADVQRMTALWALADRLGYGPAELQRLAGCYGVLDWQASRPERLAFVPRRKVYQRVMQTLTAKSQA